MNDQDNAQLVKSIVRAADECGLFGDLVYEFQMDKFVQKLNEKEDRGIQADPEELEQLREFLNLYAPNIDRMMFTSSLLGLARVFGLETDLYSFVVAEEKTRRAAVLDAVKASEQARADAFFEGEEDGEDDA